MNKKEQIQKTLKKGKILLWVGIPVCLLSPLLFTQFNLISFNTTGQIGDTIGGITSPFINILGSILVFLALKAQIDANLMIQDQMDSQETEKKLSDESKQLNQYYNNLKSSIDNFNYRNLALYSIKNNDPIYNGSEAIYQLISDYFCSYHGNEDDIKSNPKITELISMLEICEKLLIKIKSSDVPDKETLWTLTSHQFLYRIFPRLSNDFPDKIETYRCEDCQMDHGFPTKVSSPIKNIYEMINNGL